MLRRRPGTLEYKEKDVGEKNFSACGLATDALFGCIILRAGLTVLGHYMAFVSMGMARNKENFQF